MVFRCPLQYKSNLWKPALCLCDIREKAAAPVCAKPFRVGEECGTSAKKESEERTGRAHKQNIKSFNSDESNKP